MPPNPHSLLQQFGLTTIQLLELISERHGHAIWRVTTPERSYVLKWLPEAAAGIEVQAYHLLRRLGVPTLPLYASTTQALLLEDLAHSQQWRLAEQIDSARAEVGQAVARWYHTFHATGKALLANEAPPAFLSRETDALTSASLLAAAQALGLADHPVWALASSHIERLKAALEKLSLTLNYNDFHWTNLALSRTQPLQAIIFDYHLLGIGMRTSDCRNVAGSLAGEAIDAFWQTYGPVDPREVIFDRPLADLYSLHAATLMPQLPRWAHESIERINNGSLERDLLDAIWLAEEITKRD